MNKQGLAENPLNTIGYHHFMLLLLSMVIVVLMPLAFSGNANGRIKSQAEKVGNFRGHNETESLFSNNPATNKILVFSKTSGYRHDSIPNGIAAIQSLGQQNDFTVDATEDAAAITDANLAQYKAVVFLSTTGDVLNTDQQAAFERFIRSG